MPRILENKARALADQLISRGMATSEDRASLVADITACLVSGGDYKILEDEDGKLHVKTIVRNESGRVMGQQG